MLLAVLIAARTFAQGTIDPETERSCREFVQAFYDWYVPKALDERIWRAWDTALKQKKNQFGKELIRKLSEDTAAQRKSKELVSLDFDPFLNSQDPSERFVVKRVARKGDTFWVEVRGMESGELRETVFPELVHTNDGHWEFVNFHYGKSKFSEDQNLLRTLDLLRQGRTKSGN
jgi:hypothetical protein